MLTTTNHATGAVKVESDKVLRIHEFEANRNMSDTLDYSDYQYVKCQEALIYRGRVVPGTPGDRVWMGSSAGYMTAGEELPVQHRFVWVDFSNHFAWRNGETRNATVDGGALADPDIQVDMQAWDDWKAEQNRIAAEKARKLAAEQKKIAEEREKNKVVVGKKMVVCSGRKVPVGTEGTVAYVHSSGRVLLKKDSEWQDRKADGQWVDGRHLKAR